MSEVVCCICAEPRHPHPQAYACDRCGKIIRRPEIRLDAEGRTRKPDRQARIRALQKSWDKNAKVFRCFYTGVPLLTDPQDRSDHRYLSLEHQTPGDETDIVVVSLLLNRMKTDLTAGEFERMVEALAAKFRTGVFDKDAFPDRPFRSS